MSSLPNRYPPSKRVVALRSVENCASAAYCRPLASTSVFLFIKACYSAASFFISRQTGQSATTKKKRNSRMSP
jgi:hypothetical protein